MTDRRNSNLGREAGPGVASSSPERGELVSLRFRNVERRVCDLHGVCLSDAEGGRYYSVASVDLILRTVLRLSCIDSYLYGIQRRSRDNDDGDQV